ncbi:MAG: cellobiose phosphorylase [Lachnospiraceae bacterium]|nr:cellobiose phosphorylase [Lachnospiraceae bacterium]
MKKVTFTDNKGSFTLDTAGEHTGLYFPIAGEAGLKSAITPDLNGDAKIDQNHFLYEPVSSENLHNNRSSRNFWCIVPGQKPWSATGVSTWQQAVYFDDKKEQVTVSAGYMWHKTERTSEESGLKAAITSFVPVNINAEVHMVEVTNISDKELKLTMVAALPIYGRSADNIRDHRHVTSLLHRTYVRDYGIYTFPTLSFDERGHQLNDTIYYVQGKDAKGEYPESFFPEVSSFIGENGNFERPEAVIKNKEGVKPGFELKGQESLGGLRFAEVTLAPGQSTMYTVCAGVSVDEAPSGFVVDDPAAELKATIDYWTSKVNVDYATGDADFNQFMNWISFQPELRRVYGCSFLPHHDYGKGGRGWRDLWQDCLALLLMNPGGVREMLLGNFAGVRVDGSNATIIGSKVGEFKADRNSITRVWMDHGVWPLMTTKLYIDQTGDINILKEEVAYFKDRQVKRGMAVDGEWTPDMTWQVNGNGAEYHGSVLEHLLLQNLTAFWEVGEHNHIRLRDADWNDALDMAGERGESVAFANAYARNLLDLADLVEELGEDKVALLDEISVLLKDDAAVYDSIDGKNAVLEEYLAKVTHFVTGNRSDVSAKGIAASLRNKGKWIMEHIRKTEWISDTDGNGWYNGYYDNSGRRLEGITDGKANMMLTSQVFSVMSGTATKEQVAAIAASADKYLYDADCGGYRLNTDYNEIKTDMGRMFGFAFGEKENGAVFSHMAVMYANALYRRGFAKEGFKSLNTLYTQAMNMDKSHIYPGIPEYFGKDGRGLYHYLTGAASWYMLTVVNEMFGVCGSLGDLVVDPKLVKSQFDADGKAGITLNFAGRRWDITITNPSGREYGEYAVKSMQLDGDDAALKDGRAVVDLKTIEGLDKETVHKLTVVLG